MEEEERRKVYRSLLLAAKGAGGGPFRAERQTTERQPVIGEACVVNSVRGGGLGLGSNGLYMGRRGGRGKGGSEGSCTAWCGGRV